MLEERRSRRPTRRKAVRGLVQEVERLKPVSQMAEAFARLIGGVEAYSAGSRPSGRVNPKAIEAMQELGYDLTVHQSKSLDDLPDVEFDVAVTMGCGDECPFLKASRREDWSIPDPKVLPPEEFRKIRDLIGEKVRALFNCLQSGIKAI